MRWQNERRSDNLEDRRGSRMSGPIKGGGIGLLLLALVGMYFGIDPALIMNIGGALQQSGQSTQQSGPVQESSQEKQLREFVSVVLADTEDNWNAIFRANGKNYQEPKLVLFRDAVQSACGFAQAAMGPFYCPADQRVYIDLSFYEDLKNKMNAPGDFAQAYVIAHEVGHHVQNLLGITNQMQAMRQRVSQTEYNQLSVRLELQADCFAGIWAHNADRTKNLVEPGDIDEALNAASQIGDDRLQKRQHGYITPDSFTHGTSAQRVSWFRRGYEKGSPDSCDTFNTPNI
ncbi:MAG: flagellar biosynthesis protein FlgM [Desulfobulbaceae bacterium]|nr:flagellar biosynthesis protein FlgM [Desulfobulbaceae bacterium]